MEEGKVQSPKVIEKVENKLGITLRKQKKVDSMGYGLPEPLDEPKREISFKDTKNLTISHLQELEKKQEAEKIKGNLDKLDDEMNSEMKS